MQLYRVLVAISATRGKLKELTNTYMVITRNVSLLCHSEYRSIQPQLQCTISLENLNSTRHFKANILQKFLFVLKELQHELLPTHCIELSIVIQWTSSQVLFFSFFFPQDIFIYCYGLRAHHFSPCISLYFILDSHEHLYFLQRFLWSSF